MALINPQTLDYIATHASDDIRQLALKGAPEEVDLPLALDQIAGRQTARHKLPSWAATDGIIYPPHLSMEQCSSEATARYKASLVRRLQAESGQEPQTMADLTGGFGVDFSLLARSFAEATYVDRQPHLCDLARHNFACLGLKQARVVTADATEMLEQMQPVELLFIDPARRDAAGARTFAISDCTPDILELKGLLLARARHVLVKLSPMLDWRKAVADLGECVGEVHIVAVGGECKELLLVLSSAFHGLERLCCVHDGEVFDASCSLAAVQDLPQGAGQGTLTLEALSQPGLWLYEPDASVMKAGCFDLLGRRMGVRQIDRNSHLFIASERTEHFPGREFRVDKVTTMNKKDLKKALGGMSQANIAVRNFPMRVADLRGRLKLGEGGSTYIFATTLTDKTHVLFVCSKAGSGQ